MFRNNVENTNENYSSFLGIKRRRDRYLEDTSTTKEDDEISRSLQKFALSSTVNGEPSQSNNPVDIMQDFAYNGNICDELKYQNFSPELPSFSDINVRGSLWKMLPSNTITEYNRKPQPTKRYNNTGTKSEKYSPAKHCVFCENNREDDAVVKSHAVRDALGRVLCPKLRTYTCPICGASGDKAHTVKYCPKKPIITMEDAIKAESFRLAKNTYYKPQMKT